MDRTTLLRLLTRFLEPVAGALDDPSTALALVRSLGYEPPAAFGSFNALDAALDAVIELIHDIEDLRADAGGDAYAQLSVQATIATGQLVRGFQQVVDAVANDAALAPLVANTDFVAELPRRLLDYLAVRLLQRTFPRTTAALALGGLIEERLFENAGDPHLSTHMRKIVHWERLPRAMTDVVGLLKEVYGWDAPALEYQVLLERLLDLALALGVYAERDAPREEAAAAIASVGATLGQDEGAAILRIPLLPGLAAPLGIEMHPLFAGGNADGFGVGVYLDANAALIVPISARWQAEVTVASNLRAGFGVLVRRGRPLEFLSSIYAAGGASNLPATEIDARLALTYLAPDGRIVLLGAAGATNLSVGGLRVSIGVERDLGSGADIAADVGLQDGVLAIRTGEGDGFLQQILPPELTLSFDFLVGFSTRRGLYFQGSGGFETTIPLHVELGPIALEYLTVGLWFLDGGLRLELSLTGGATLGPIQASVDRIGAIAALRFEGGNLGPAHLALRFKPPTGLGLAIDAGPVSGGGYISFEPERGRYAGVLDLDVYGIGVTAIGLLDTRTEAGEPLPPPGFSFLLIISAEFQGVQLGFGFTLNGVGGLVGIHRTMALDALRSGVRDGSLDHIMFPADPVRNMPQIISDLRAFFPVAPGRYLFGPMARVGWGTPTLFEGEIGIILEVPMPVVIALIGQVNVSLPDEDAGVVSIHVSILGIVDFGKKLLSIDASMYDSRIAAFAIYGDMALRLSWGDPPSFALSIGGLNPHFQPPPEFPTLRAVTVSLGMGDNPRVSLQGYLAITSNSIQFGAAAELYAAAGELNVHGWLKFDALVVFSPFHFRFDYSTGFALRWGEDIIAGISITGMLSGPSPYHIRGEGCISVLFVDVCVGFDVTIGERVHVELPPRNPWESLAEAIRDPRNWSAALPPGVRTAVTFRAQPDPDVLLVHPMGSVTLRQKVVPLNSRIEKLGEFPIIGPDRFDVAGVEVGARAAAHEIVTDFFAPGQFEELSNAEKLSQPSFEKMPAGIAVGSARVVHGDAASVRVAEVGYETTIIDDPRARGRAVARPGLSGAVQLAQGRQGARAQSTLRRSGTEKYSRPDARGRVVVQDEDYAIAGTQDTHLRLEFGTGLTRTIARQILDAHLAEHPEDIGRLDVVLRSEVEAPA